MAITEMRKLFCNRSLMVMIATGGTLLLVLAAILFFRSLNGPPFRLLMEPGNGKANVQFVQPGAGLVSPRITVMLGLDKPYDLSLDAASVPIPGGHIEFADTTILPGRFKMRIGNKLFDVMVREIYVDGKPMRWERP